MNRFQRKVILRVLGIHVAVIAFLVLQSLVHGCFRPEPKREIVTFVDFGAPMPTPEVVQVESMPEPEPAPVQERVTVPEQPKPKPVPKPLPTPEPKPVPEQPEPKPQPKPEPKPTWKATKPSEIDPSKSKRINAEPTQPVLRPEEIREEFSEFQQKRVTKPGNPDEIAAYVNSVVRYLYPYWTPPASSSSETGPCVIRFSIQKNGRITARKKVQSSGDSLYDQSAMDAAMSVSTVPVPPASYPYDYVEIEFIRN